MPDAAAQDQPENLFKTPSPSGKNLKFDLSGLDDKQKTIVIPDPAIASAAAVTHAETTEKVQKPAKLSRKKRNFAAMLGGSATGGNGLSHEGGGMSSF